MEKAQKDIYAYRRTINRDQLVTIGDLLELKQELIQEFTRLLQNKRPSQVTQNKWLKTHQAQKLLGCSRGTLLTLRANGTLPSRKVGGTIFYSADEIEKVLSDSAKQLKGNVLLHCAKKT